MARPIGSKNKKSRVIERTCLKCGAKFLIHPYRLLTAKYCSFSCHAKDRKLSKATRKKLSRGMAKLWLEGKMPVKHGAELWNWKGGISKRPNYRRIYRKNAAPGTHTKAEWENAKKRANFKCLCCGKSEPEIKLTEDHIIPLIKGGSDFIENIQPLCQKCNSKKFTKVIKYQYA